MICWFQKLLNCLASFSHGQEKRLLSYTVWKFKFAYFWPTLTRIHISFSHLYSPLSIIFSASVWEFNANSFFFVFVHIQTHFIAYLCIFTINNSLCYTFILSFFSCEIKSIYIWDICLNKFLCSITHFYAHTHTHIHMFIILWSNRLSLIHIIFVYLLYIYIFSLHYLFTIQFSFVSSFIFNVLNIQHNTQKKSLIS